MDTRILLLGAVCLAVLPATTGQALLIPINDPTLAASADGFNITQDTSTGLEWLDIDISLGRTFDDLVGNDGSNEFGPGGDFEGFRYATDLEVTGQDASGRIDSLFKSAGLGVPSFAFIGGYPGVRDFLALVGCFGECTSYGYAYGAMVDNGGAESEIYVEAFAFQGFDWGRSDRNVALTPRFPNNGFPLAKGNWLVRPIPEPSTGLLLGLGITGFAVLRRRL